MSKKITTTLNLLQNTNPYKGQWDELIDYLDSDQPREKSIDLLTILEINGIYDTLSTLKATQEDPRGIAVRFAYECALEVLPLFEKEYPENERPKETLRLVKHYIEKDEIPEEKKLGSLSTAYATMKEAENMANMASYLSHNAKKSAFFAANTAYEALYATETDKDTVYIPARMAAQTYEMAEAYEMGAPSEIIETSDQTKTFLTRLLTKLLKG